MIRTDLGLHAAVRAALRGALGATAARVGVVVRDGIVTLSGAVDTAQDKLAAERAVQYVPGVHAVAEELRVLGQRSGDTSDELIASQILAAFQSGAHPIGRDVTLRVEHGWVVLSGVVASSAEQAAVERALECVAGIRGITSEVRIDAWGEPLAANRVAPVESIMPLAE